MRYPCILAIRPTVRFLRVLFCTALCAAFLGGAVIDTGPSPTVQPDEYSIWKKRIKRLKPADPESSEEMLAQTETVRSPDLRG